MLCRTLFVVPLILVGLIISQVEANQVWPSVPFCDIRFTPYQYYEDVTVCGDWDEPGFPCPIGDIYIIRDDGTDYEVGEALSDALWDGKTTVVGCGAGGAFYDVVVAQNPLPPGRYDIVLDENQDGQFSGGDFPDYVLGNGVSWAFEVSDPGCVLPPSEPECQGKPKAYIVEAWDPSPEATETVNTVRAHYLEQGWDATILWEPEFFPLMQMLHADPCVRGLYIDTHGTKNHSILIRDSSRPTGAVRLLPEDLHGLLASITLDQLTIIACYVRPQDWRSEFESSVIRTPLRPIGPDGLTGSRLDLEAEAIYRHGTPLDACVHAQKSTGLAPVILREERPSLSAEVAGCASFTICDSTGCGEDLYPTLSCRSILDLPETGEVGIGDEEAGFTASFYFPSDYGDSVAATATLFSRVPADVMALGMLPIGRFLLFADYPKGSAICADSVRVTMWYEDEELALAGISTDASLRVHWVTETPDSGAYIPCVVDTLRNQVQFTAPKWGLAGLYGRSNTPPTCDAGGPYSGTVGSEVAFDGTASADLDGTIQEYVWDFGDESGAEGAQVSHIYTDGGAYTVTLTVADDDWESSICTTSADIKSPPICDIAGPYGGKVGAIIVFDGSASSDPDGEIVSFHWEFGDGATGSGPTVSHVYDEPSVYTLHLSLTDDDGMTGTCSTEVVVQPADENLVNNFSFEGGSIPVGWPTTYGVWSGEPVFVVGAQYGVTPIDGSKMLKFRWTGLTTPHTNTTTCEIYQLVDLSSYVPHVVRGSAVATLRGAFNRIPGDDQTDTQLGVWLGAYRGNLSSWITATPLVQDYGFVFTDDDTSTWETGQLSVCLPTDTEFLVVAVKAWEDVFNDGSDPEFDGHYCDAVSLTIGVAPNCNAGGPYVGEVGQVIMFRATDSTDPDGTIVGYDWDFGDGSGATGITAEHAYDEEGLYTVTLVVTDAEGFTAECTAGAEVFVGGWIRLAEPDRFKAEKFAEVPAGRQVISMAFPTESASSYPAFLYATARETGLVPNTGLIYSITDNGEIARLGSHSHDDLFLHFSNRAFGDKLCGIDPSWPTSHTDGIYSISPFGVPTLLNALGGGNPDASSMAFGRDDIFGQYLYVASHDEGAGDSRYDFAIARVDSTGAFTSQLLYDPNGPYTVAISPGGMFGNYLYYGVAANAEIYRTTEVGTVTRFGSVPSSYPRSLEFSSDDAFGDYLYVLGSGWITRIDAAGDSTRFATGGGLVDLAFNPNAEEMYVATVGGTIYRIVPQSPVSIRILSLRATLEEAGVLIEWETGRGGDSVGFYVYRRTQSGPWQRLNSILLTGGPSYSFGDDTATAGAHYEYVVESVSRSGDVERFGPVEVEIPYSAHVELRAAPNPTNGHTTVHYTLPVAGGVTVQVFDLVGRLVENLVQGPGDAGTNEAYWDGRDHSGRLVPAGIYFIRLETAAGVRGLRIVIMR